MDGLNSKAVEVARQAFMEGGRSLLQVLPVAIETIIAQRLWSLEPDATGKPFKTFEAFVVHPLWQGLECSMSDLLHYCRKRPDVQGLIRAEIEQLQGHGGVRTEQGDIVTLKRGNSPAYALARLKRDSPEMAEKVVRGELSAHKAAVMAGIKKPRWSAPEQPEELAVAIEKKYPGWKMVKEDMGGTDKNNQT
jgi:hypothetical protein